MRPTRLVLAVLGLAALLPLASDAGNSATCCNVAASYQQDLFPGGAGDEDFFTVPGGPPNVMVLLDTSGSMLNFPQALDYSSITAGQGTCDVTSLRSYATAQASNKASFESRWDYNTASGTTRNGNKSTPEWVYDGTSLDTCSKITGSHKDDTCLFNPGKFYFYDGVPTDVGGGAGNAPWTTTATVPNRTFADASGACSGLSTTSSPTLGACTSCLASSGYYVWIPQGSNTRKAAFSGKFLNVYPPKFIIARKVLKDLASIDPKNPSTTDNVRFGLTRFDEQEDSHGAKGLLKVPLLPACSEAIGQMDNSKFVAARQLVIDEVDKLTFTGVTPLANTLFRVAQYFSSSTSSSSDGSNWQKWFPSNWDSGFDWMKKDPSVSNAPANSSICWPCQQSSVIVITDGAPNNDNRAVPGNGCSGPAQHDQLLNCSGLSGKGDFQFWGGATAYVDPSLKKFIDCPGCGTDLSYTSQKNLLHLVAAFMRYNDLGTDTTATAAGSTVKLTGAQTVTTHTIGLNLAPGSTAEVLLQKTAYLGGGNYENANDANDLANALSSAVSTIISKATSFSVSNTNTLQAATAAQLFTARFRPLDRLSWEGHLYRFTLFNKFALGCDATKPLATQSAIPAAAGACTKWGTAASIDGKTVSGSGTPPLADCSDFYIVDSECDPVLEDSVTGAFTKAPFVNGVQTPGAAAKPYWDAGQVLSTPTAAGYRSADDPAGTDPYDVNDRTHRRILTVIDNDAGASTGDGRLDRKDKMIDFSIANVALLKPYLGLDTTWCTNLYGRINAVRPTGQSDADFLTDCAKQVIWFVRGWDVLDEDEDGCAGPVISGVSSPNLGKLCSTDADCSPSTAGVCAVVSGTTKRCTCASGEKGEERDLANGHWKLGDIFHSSPQPVEAPFNEVLCDIGRAQTQCVATIHSPDALNARTTQTAIARDSSNRDAYEQWRLANVDRQRIVLAGANDGMLHAFDGGKPDTSQPRDVFGSYPYTVGTGEELWTFIPTDLLPKLKFALDGHQYFVDGNIMVRDVWYDANTNRIKENDEFHTVAILSERSGGSQFIALDVSDPLRPSLLWTFPQLCSLEQTQVGQSWTDFSPRPPPIGPVRIALPSGRKDDLGRTFEERWIAVLNGGYDNALLRGRGVWMVDVWTGDVLWRFTDKEFGDMYKAAGKTTGSGLYPVPASVGLVDIGSANQATLDSDGFFDTATWGDLGGQVWVARFKEPGIVGANGLISNWVAGRAFEELRQANDDQVFWVLNADGTYQLKNEFYRMTSNIWEPTTSTLRTYLGSGNRDKLLSVQPMCGASSFIGCSQNDCGVVGMESTVTWGSCTIKTVFKNNNGKFQKNLSGVTDGCNASSLTCGSGVKVDLSMNVNTCKGLGGKGANTGNISNVAGKLYCDAAGNCTTRERIGISKTLSTVGWTNTNHNRFYGIWAFSADRANPVATPTNSMDSSDPSSAMKGAVYFDQNRFTDVPIGVSCTGTSGSSCTLVNVTTASVDNTGKVTCGSGVTKCQADTGDAGWFYEYGRTCPTGDCTGQTLPWTDEKTGSGATVLGSCVDWNTIRPMGMALTSTPCTSGTGLPANYTYLADSISGVPNNKFCGFPSATSNLVYRATQRRSIAPPLDPTTVVTVSATGGVRQTALQIEPGVLQKKDLASSSDVVRPIYWLEVPRDLHACRHADGTLCK